MCKTKCDEICVTFFLPRSFVLIIITLNAWSQSPKRRHQQTRRNEAVMSLRDWRLQTQRILLQFFPISRFFTWGKTKYPSVLWNFIDVVWTTEVEFIYVIFYWNERFLDKLWYSLLCVYRYNGITNMAALHLSRLTNLRALFLQGK